MITRNQKANWHTFCSEPLELVENYRQAEADGFEGWCMHHRREIQPDGTRVSAKELIDQGLYYGRPASELIFLRFGEHTSLHMLGKPTWNKGKHLSEEHRRNMSAALKGRTLSEEHRQKIAEALSGENNPRAMSGKHHSAETRQKMSEEKKGSIFWNDGVSCKRSRECPGEGWKRGRLKASRTSCKT